MRKRARVIPKNVLAQEALRRKYAEEPWPQNLILVKSALEDNDIRVRGQETGLFYNLSYPYLYIDSRDLAGLGDMVIKSGAERRASNAKTIRGSKGDISKLDSSADAGQTKPTGKRKRGRPRKSSRSETDGATHTGKDGRVSARDNE